MDTCVSWLPNMAFFMAPLVVCMHHSAMPFDWGVSERRGDVFKISTLHIPNY